MSSVPCFPDAQVDGGGSCPRDKNPLRRGPNTLRHRPNPSVQLQCFSDREEFPSSFHEQTRSPQTPNCMRPICLVSLDFGGVTMDISARRSEEHTSELQ